VLVTLAHRSSEYPKSQMMGLPAFVQQPFSMTEVETKATPEAIFASSELTIRVAPALANKRPAAPHQELPTSRRNRKIRQLPYSQGQGGRVRLAH
jgi:hypothetical protein